MSFSYFLFGVTDHLIVIFNLAHISNRTWRISFIDIFIYVWELRFKPLLDRVVSCPGIDLRTWQRECIPRCWTTRELLPIQYILYIIIYNIL